MLARSAQLPTRPGYAFEPKMDGFRAILSTVDEFRVYSRRRWDMTPLPSTRPRYTAPRMLLNPSNTGAAGRSTPCRNEVVGELRRFFAAVDAEL
jgi:hypothetical protein